MATNDLKNFLIYAKDVLGIKHLVTSKADADVTAQINTDLIVQLIISVFELSSYTADEHALLEKMITALQLGDISYRIQDAKVMAAEAPYYLILVDQISNLDAKLSNTVITFSPRKLLQEPHLKKVAWSEMQILLQKIKNP